MVTADFIWNFSQEDLQSEIVAMLDAYNAVYLWIGGKSRETDKKIAMETAVEYVQKATDGRPKTTVLNVKEGSEPIGFISTFHGWEGAVTQVQGITESVHEALKEYSPDKLYSYEELKKMKEKDTLPKSIDKTELEVTRILTTCLSNNRNI